MKTAIVALTRGYSENHRYNSLIKRNHQIYNTIYSGNEEKYDVIIFHEGNITISQQEFIQSTTPKMKLIFSDVKNVSFQKAFDNSKNIINKDLCPPTRLSSSFPLGYKHMCHFWSIDFLEYLKDYKFVIRIDEDCFISKFNQNIIDNMEKNEIHYISPMFQGQDEPDVIVGMKKMWENFITVNKVTPFKSFEEIKCPYTNLFVMNLEFFIKNENVVNLLRAVDESGGIYSNRWGDLPIWGMILSTLIEDRFYSDSDQISYFHSSHNKKVN